MNEGGGVATVKSFKTDVSCISPSSRNTACYTLTKTVCEQVLHRNPRDHYKLARTLVENLYLFITWRACLPYISIIEPL